VTHPLLPKRFQITIWSIGSLKAAPNQLVRLPAESLASCKKKKKEKKKKKKGNKSHGHIAGCFSKWSRPGPERSSKCLKLKPITTEKGGGLVNRA
jgi:hypothetical protein